MFAELEAPALRGLKKDMIAALRANRRKPRHKEQFQRLYEVARFGAHTWWTRWYITYVNMTAESPLTCKLCTLEFGILW